MRKNRLVARELTRAFWLIFCAFLTLVILHATSWERNREDVTAFAPGFALALGVFAALAVVSVLIKEGKRERAWLPLLLFFASLFLRLLILRAMGQNTGQISDFGNAVSASYKEPPNYGQYYNLYPHWYMQIKYLAALRHIGKLPAAGLALNALVSSLSAALVYSVASQSLESRRIGFLAAAIFLLWPAHLFYAVVLSPEYLNIFFCLLSLWLMLKAHKAYAGHPGRACLLFIMSGIALALSGFFKTTDRIVLLALLIALCVRALYAKKEKTGRKKPFIKKFRSEAAFVLLMVIAYGLSVEAGYLYIEKDSGRDVNRHSLSYFLYVGLSPATNGTWTEAAAAYYVDLAEELNDYNALSDQVLGKLRGELRGSGHLGRKLVNDKIRLAWADDDYLWLPDMTMDPQTKWPFQPGVWIGTFSHYVQAYYMTVCLLALAAAVCLFFRGDMSLLFLSALVVFGFALVLVAIEVQSRYKCVVYPFLSILAARGLALLPVGRMFPVHGRSGFIPTAKSRLL
jgi:hypothetical protein